MFNISNFLEKFSKNIQSNENDKRQILEIIKKQTGIELSNQSMEIKNYILYVNTSPAIKNKIFIYKKQILGEINNQSIKMIDIM